MLSINGNNQLRSKLKMTNFMKLTVKSYDADGDYKTSYVWIDVNSIICFHPIDNNNHTSITLSSGDKFYIQDTCEELMTKLFKEI